MIKKIPERVTTWYNKVYNGIISSKPVNWIISRSKKIVLPGFNGVPLYDVAVFFYHGIRKGDLNTRASALAFSLFLAIFPAIIFFFTLIPYIPIVNFQESLMNILAEFIPTGIYNEVEGTLFDIINRPRGGLLSLGFVLAMFFATNSVHSLIDAFNQTYYTIETRSAFRQRLISIFLVFVLSFLVILAIGLITFGPVVIRWIQDIGLLTDTITLNIIIVGKWLVTFGLLFFAFAVLYYFAPAVKQKFRFVNAGTTLATILFIFTSIGFNIYVNNFARYNTLYGSIGTLIIFLLWLYVNSLIVLIGWELNASIAVAKRSYDNI